MAPRIAYTPITSTAKLQELCRTADKMWDEAVQLYTDTSDWKLVKDTSVGCVLYCKRFNDKRVVYKTVGDMPLHEDKLMDAFYSKEGLENMPNWNATLEFMQILQNVDDETFLMYEATAPAGPGGMVASRDFVVIVRLRKVGNKYMMCYGSVQLDELPPCEGRVRATIRPSVVVVGPSQDGNPDQCSFVHTVDVDLRLQFVPDAIFNQVLKYTALENAKNFRDRCCMVREGKVLC